VGTTNNGSSTATVAGTVTGVADLTLTKVASNNNSGTAGGTISYTVTLVNLGPSAAQSVTLTDVLGAGLTLVSASSNNAGGTTTVVGASVGATTTSLAIGQTLTLIVNVTVSSSASGSVTNTAAGTSTTPDPTPGNNTTTLVVPVVSLADVSASFVGFPVSAPVNTVVSGTANFVNTNATNTATTAVFTITLVPGLANVTVTSDVLGTGVYNSVSGVVTFTPPTVVNVTPSGTVSAAISFVQTTTTVAGTGTGNATNDTNSGNNTATFSVLGTAADMSASFAGFPASAPAGSIVSGTVSYVNTSATNTATTPTFSLNLTAGLGAANVTITSAVLGAGTYNNATGSVTFATPAPGVLAAGGTVTVTLTYLQGTTTVAGTATTGAVNDTNAANNTATFSVTGSVADLSASFVGFPVSAPVNTVVS
ncbi:MAG: hypothetical protein V4455_04970, partial [Pseudomonadota bacterium]